MIEFLQCKDMNRGKSNIETWVETEIGMKRNSLNKCIALGMSVMCLFSLAGCKNDVKLTSEQNELIAEYTAGVLLKYSYENEWKYTKLNTALNTYNNKNDTSATKPSGSNSNNNNNNNSATVPSGGNTAMNPTSSQTSGDLCSSLPQALGLTGTTISYESVSVGDRYPTGEYAVCVPAESGCKVVAVEFKIKNDSGNNILANTTASGVAVKLTVNGTSYPGYISMLKNDMLNLKSVSIASGSSYNAVLLFQVKSESANSVKGSVLSVTSGGTSLGTLALN